MRLINEHVSESPEDNDHFFVVVYWIDPSEPNQTL
jgi:hypothetical protein